VSGDRPRPFATVILDVDSTLSGIEGIDWLAARRGADVAARVAELTDRAMRGEIPLDAVYGERLGLVRPSAGDVAELAEAYAGAVAPGAAEAIARLREAGRTVVLVSGGLREAIVPLAASVGVAAGDVHAVGVRFDAAGAYAGFDAASPLTTQGGKRVIAERLGLPRPALAVGDGATDAAMRPAVDSFAAFTGFVRRDRVVSDADHDVSSFSQLTELVLG
jgi:phosphoserine phosphatase